MERHPQDPIAGYCDGCKMINHDGKCSVWPNVCKRTGADRGGHIGCPFSPLEVTEVARTKQRVGQQKQKKGIIKS
jgi:hypothetical protein